MVGYMEWIGCGFGAFGALLLAMNRPYSGWGFVAFLASNVCWMVFGVATGAMGLVAMQMVMTGTSLLGIYRWMPVRKASGQLSRAKGVAA